VLHLAEERDESEEAREERGHKRKRTARS
jgi:hypothetical protein